MDIVPFTTGRLPSPEGASGDRIGRLRTEDLGRDSIIDLTDRVAVTSAVTTRFQLPDLVVEAASAGLITPRTLKLTTPIAVLDGVPLYVLMLVSKDALDPFRRFVDSARFELPDGVLTAFLHAVVVAHPFARRPFPADEDAWVRSAHAHAGLVKPPAVLRPINPTPLTLWTVGVEHGRRSTRLRSGFRAAIDRTPTRPIREHDPAESESRK